MRNIYFVGILCIFSSSHLFGKIKNGYENNLQLNREALQKLNTQLLTDKDMARAIRLKIKSKIEALVEYISFYELTEMLIDQLRMFSPGIYAEMDSIRDKKGRSTDIYVKIISKEKSRIQLKAASFLKQARTDGDANISEYGAYSVSVEIWLVDNASFLLSHELGHLKYIVPNLAAYSKFYNRLYAKTKIDVSFIGHSRHDPSGKYADNFGRQFVKDKALYLKNGGKKPEPLFVLFNRILKNNRNIGATHSTIASNYFY